MTIKKKKTSRKTVLLFGAVSGASLIMPFNSTDAMAQTYSCETGGAIQDQDKIAGCAVLVYGLTPPEEIGLAAPVQPPPSGNIEAENGGTYTL